MLHAIWADITTLTVDVVVNAANTSLLGGSGVDGAIHRAAGSDLLHECRLLGGCKTGDAKITKGYRLPAKWIVHTVGPVWQDGRANEPMLLANCYRRSLDLAAQYHASSIAFPCISTGIYKFPAQMAAEIAIQTVHTWLKRHSQPMEVTFCCFCKDNLEIYQSLLSGISLGDLD